MNKAVQEPPDDEPFLVCIDPGHPSETSAGASANGVSENRVCWRVALRLAARLREKGMAYCLTKQSMNEVVTNRRRAEIANERGAAILLRLHCDAGAGQGFALYYPDRAGRKNGVVGPPRDVQVGSRIAAQILQPVLSARLRPHLRANLIKTDAQTYVGGKQGGVLTGSIFARVPTVLIEMAFISNKTDARFIGGERGQQIMANALADALIAYKNHLAERDAAPNGSGARTHFRAPSGSL